MAQQLFFDLPALPALGREDFFAASANAVALAFVDQWPDWPDGKLVLLGPEGSGKTHLVHVWAKRSNARIISATDLADVDVPAMVDRPVAVEDVTRIAGDGACETALFHLHNLLRAEGQSLMLTAQKPPSRWGLALPDLTSRMMAAATTEIDPPDDLLLSVVMAKLFADRQIVPTGDVIPYLVNRIDRSFAIARKVVAAMDDLALSEKRDVTRPIAARVIADLEQVAD